MIQEENGRNLPDLIFDTSALISAARYEIKRYPILDYVLESFNLYIPEDVKKEAVDEGLQGGYPDAVFLDQRIQSGNIRVQSPLIARPNLEKVLSDYGIENGDKDLIRLCIERKEYHSAVVDDRLLYIVLNRFNLRPSFLPDLIEWLVINGKWKISIGELALRTIQPRYRKGFINHSIEKIYGRL